MIEKYQIKYGRAELLQLLDQKDVTIKLGMEKNSGKIYDNENGYSYVFDNISVGIYRTATLESVQQDIEDMKADGEYSQEYDDEEMFRANHWATIGIGTIGYYSN